MRGQDRSPWHLIAWALAGVLVALIAPSCGENLDEGGGSSRLGSSSVYGVDLGSGRAQWRSGGGETSYPPLLLEGDILYSFEQTGKVRRAVVRALSAASGEEVWQLGLADRHEVRGPIISEGVLVFKVVPSGPRVIFDSSKPHGAAGYETIVAVDATSGERLWTLRERDVLSEPVVWRDTVIFAELNGGALQARRLRNGDVVWRVDGMPTSGEPFLGQRSVFIGTDDGTVVALDASTGDLLWTRNLGSDVLFREGVMRARTVYVVVDDVSSALGSHLYALDSKSGVRLWDISAVYIGGPGEMLATDSTVYVGASTGVGKPASLWAIESRTGNRVWHYRSAFGGIGPPAMVGGEVLITDFSPVNGGSANGALVALAAGNGDVQWKMPLRGLPSYGTTVAGRLVLVGLHKTSSSGTVLAVHLDSGQPIWKVPVPGLIAAPPSAIGSRVFFAVDISD